MFAITRTTTKLYPSCYSLLTMSSQGSIKEAGGSFAKMQVAREEEYFYKKSKEQLNKLKDKQIDQKDYHKQQIELHEAEIKRHRDHLKSSK